MSKDKGKSIDDGQEDLFGGFKDMFEDLTRPDESAVDNPSKPDEDKVVDGTGNTVIDDDPDKDDKYATKDPDDVDDDIKDTDDEPAADDDDDIKVDDDIKDTDDDDSDVNDLGEYEDDVTEFFVDKFEESIGFEFEDEDKPKNVKEMVDRMVDIIQENSAPTYSDPSIAELDEFVKNGGTVKKFYDEVYKTVDPEELDLESESNQKLAIKESLKIKGYQDSYIKRKIERYEDAGVLEEEAEEASEIIKDYKKEKAEKLLTDQKTYQRQAVEEQQKFITNVKEIIDATESIRGMSIPKAKRQRLKEYILKQGTDGRTGYQKDYSKSLKHLVESAFFTMEGDNMVKTISNKAKSEATKNLKKKLSTSRKDSSSKLKSNSSGKTGGSTKEYKDTLSLFAKGLM